MKSSFKVKALNQQIDTVKEKKRTSVKTINELHTDADLYISQAEGCSIVDQVTIGKVHLFWKDYKRERAGSHKL